MTERKDLGVVRRSVKESNEISPGKEGDLAAEESLFLLGRIPLGVITQSRVVEGGCDSLLHSFVSRARS